MPVGKWHSSESDVNSMVMSTSVQGSGNALMVDMGAFHLAEFAQTLCLPFVGSAVHGGLHVVQVVSQPLAMRMLMIPALDDTFKVCRNRRDNRRGLNGEAAHSRRCLDTHSCMAFGSQMAEWWERDIPCYCCAAVTGCHEKLHLK